VDERLPADAFRGLTRIDGVLPDGGLLLSMVIRYPSSDSRNASRRHRPRQAQTKLRQMAAAVGTFHCSQKSQTQSPQAVSVFVDIDLNITGIAIKSNGKYHTGVGATRA